MKVDAFFIPYIMKAEYYKNNLSFEKLLPELKEDDIQGSVNNNEYTIEHMDYEWDNAMKNSLYSLESRKMKKD